MPIGETAVVEHLEEGVEDVWMGLLNLVEQDDRVGASAHGFGELTTLLVTDVPGRGAQQPTHRVFLHVLGHVQPHHCLFVVEQVIGKRPS